MSNHESLTQKLNRETAKIHWEALADHHQQGTVVAVDTELDLISVAVALAKDNREQVEQWLQNAQIEKVNQELADTWSTTNPELWAVVVAPWVLVQKPKFNA